MNNLRQSAAKFCILMVSLTVLALVLTWVIGMILVQPPRSLFFWVSMEFLTFIEIVACLLGLNAFARARYAVQPGAAVLAIMSSILGVAAVIGIVSIVFYAVIRQGDAANDVYFATWMAAILGGLFIVAAWYYGYSLFFVETFDQPVIEGRAALDPQGVKVSDIIAQLQDVSTSDDDHARKLDLLLKDLRRVETAVHHGNGASVNGSQSVHEVVAQLGSALDTLGNDVGRLTAGEQSFAAAHDKIRSTVNELKRKVDAAGLA